MHQRMTPYHSAILKKYYIIPKSKGALAMAEQPKRAAVVASSIVFLMKEHQSHQEEWLRNHDRHYGLRVHV